jgi:predicted rRNA methylase YqxC with S4 and FtsJ domains
MGTLRQDKRVVNLEATNASELTTAHVPEIVDAVTIDVSYSPLRAIVPAITKSLRFGPSARMLALVKPMFELQAAELPTAPGDLQAAVNAAEQGIRAGGWVVESTVESPLRGNNGAVEFFVKARLLELPQTS